MASQAPRPSRKSSINASARSTGRSANRVSRASFQGPPRIELIVRTVGIPGAAAALADGLRRSVCRSQVEQCWISVRIHTSSKSGTRRSNEFARTLRTVPGHRRSIEPGGRSARVHHETDPEPGHWSRESEAGVHPSDVPTSVDPQPTQPAGCSASPIAPRTSAVPTPGDPKCCGSSIWPLAETALGLRPIRPLERKRRWPRAESRRRLRAEACQSRLVEGEAFDRSLGRSLETASTAPSRDRAGC